jgi:hypothetical protein
MMGRNCGGELHVPLTTVLFSPVVGRISRQSLLCFAPLRNAAKPSDLDDLLPDALVEHPETRARATGTGDVMCCSSSNVRAASSAVLRSFFSMKVLKPF